MSGFDDALDNIGIEKRLTNDRIESLKEECSKAGASDAFSYEKEAKPIITKITKEDREIAVAKKLVPRTYKEASFEIDAIKSNLMSQSSKNNGLYKVKNFKAYTDVCLGILSSLRVGMIPDRSFIIGAPNGFGKTSFVNECLMTMMKQGMIAVPYISLFELAEVKMAEERRLLNPYSYKSDSYTKSLDGPRNDNDYYYTNMKEPDIIKLPQDITGYYSWSEYMNTPCLFCQFTDVSSKNLESRMLYQILAIRGSKGLPTMVMMATALEPYKKDVVLREQVWEEILEYDRDRLSYDRVYHISCYKFKRNAIADKNESIDSRTGIVD